MDESRNLVDTGDKKKPTASMMKEKESYEEDDWKRRLNPERIDMGE